MKRNRAAIDRAIEAAAVHAWAKNGPEGMFDRLRIETASQLHDHITRTVWNEIAMCFFADNNREVYCDQSTNTRVILNYEGAGICLITRSGEREFHAQYLTEIERRLASGFDVESKPAMIHGGIRAMHPGIGPRRVRRENGRPNGDSDEWSGQS